MADVLLVDDNGSVLLTLAIALRRRGHTVTVANDACQALTHLRRHHFGFLVSDVRMPGMSGLELAAQAQRFPHPPRVILTSAYSNVEAHEGIAAAFLRKPIDIQELHALLCDQSTTGAVNQGIIDAAPSPTATPTRAQPGSDPAKSSPKAARDTTMRRSNRATCDPVPG